MCVLTGTVGGILDYKVRQRCLYHPVMALTVLLSTENYSSCVEKPGCAVLCDLCIDPLKGSPAFQEVTASSTNAAGDD